MRAEPEGAGGAPTPVKTRKTAESKPKVTPTYDIKPYTPRTAAAPAAGTIVGYHSPAPKHYSPPPVGQARQIPSAHSFLSGLRNIVTPIVGMDPRSFTDTYGPRIHPITGRSSFHTGIDISASAGTPIIAPSNAVLADINPGDSIYGNQLILAHNKHVETMYGHMSSYAPGLKPGMKIRAGDLIGYVGSTGLSTGPHLHWETWRDGNPVNPVTFLGGQ